MTRSRRILVLSTSVKNPFLEAWIATIRASGAEVVALVDVRRTRETEVPAVLEQDVVMLERTESSDWQDQVRSRLGGEPDVVFDWWGMAALGRRVVADAWPRIPRVLCVDTFPNASRVRAEVRDVVQANALLGRAAGLALASRSMGRAIGVATNGRFGSLPNAVVYSPFPSSAHAFVTEGAERSGPVRLCFTGRSDYLFSTEAGMAKDAVGPYLEQFVRRGAEVHVMHPGNDEAASTLRDHGFDFYPDTPRNEIISGGLARTISTFDGHLVVYAQPNRTVHRRIANSLSTRFATALCAPTPIVAPSSARFVDELFDVHPVGFRADDPDVILRRLSDEGASMTRTWHESHHEWTGEAHAEDLDRLWSSVLRS